MKNCLGLMVIGFTISLSTYAAPGTPTLYYTNFTVGPSIPAHDPALQVGTANNQAMSDLGVTRSTGGELYQLRFQSAAKRPSTNPIFGIRLIGYSKSHRGQVLVRSVQAMPAQPAAAFRPLVEFGAIGSDAKAQNHDGMVMLGNEDFVDVTLPANPGLGGLNFQMEGFGDDDASVVMQLITTAPLKGNYTFDGYIVNPPSDGGGDGGSGSTSGTCYFAGSCEGDAFGHVTNIELCPNACDSFLRDFDRSCLATH